MRGKKEQKLLRRKLVDAAGGSEGTGYKQNFHMDQDLDEGTKRGVAGERGGKCRARQLMELPLSWKSWGWGKKNSVDTGQLRDLGERASGVGKGRRVLGKADGPGKVGYPLPSICWRRMGNARGTTSDAAVTGTFTAVIVGGGGGQKKRCFRSRSKSSFL